MIKSCLECKTVCCKSGPGPYERIPVEQFLENFGSLDNYNKKCENLMHGNRCGKWGKPDFPVECRTYVCNNRSYTKQEREDISNIYESEGTPCVCGVAWHKNVQDTDGIYRNICEICGHIDTWRRHES